jgi:hypothetical protein
VKSKSQNQNHEAGRLPDGTVNQKATSKERPSAVQASHVPPLVDDKATLKLFARIEI